MSKIICAAASVLAFSAGSGAGYFLARRKFDKDFEERVAMDVENEVAAIRRLERRAQIRDIEALANPTVRQTMLESLAKDPVDLGEEGKLFYNKVQPALTADIPSKASAAFAKYQGSDEPVQIDEFDPNKPHIIPNTHFWEGEDGYNQVVLTYYEGDNTLADERDDILDAPDSVVGMANLKFGHMSADENVVYVRNTRLGTDYEICRSFGKYSVEVGGEPADEVDPLPPEVGDA